MRLLSRSLAASSLSRDADAGADRGRPRGLRPASDSTFHPGRCWRWSPTRGSPPSGRWPARQIGCGRQPIRRAALRGKQRRRAAGWDCRSAPCHRRATVSRLLRAWISFTRAYAGMKTYKPASHSQRPPPAMALHSLQGWFPANDSSGEHRGYENCTTCNL